MAALTRAERLARLATLKASMETQRNMTYFAVGGLAIVALLLGAMYVVGLHGAFPPQSIFEGVVLVTISGFMVAITAVTAIPIVRLYFKLRDDYSELLKEEG